MCKARKKVAIEERVHKRIRKIADRTNRTVDDLADDMLEKNKRRYQNADRTN